MAFEGSLRFAAVVAFREYLVGTRLSSHLCHLCDQILQALHLVERPLIPATPGVL